MGAERRSDRLPFHVDGIVNISSVKNYKEKEKMKNKRRYAAAIVLASIMTSILVAG